MTAKQEKLLQLMIALKELAEEIQMEYVIHSGTLLGAVRGEGFIPWDEDVDIVLTRNHYDALSLFLASQSIYEIDKYSGWVPRFRLKSEPDVYLDLFIIDYLPSMKVQRRIKLFRLKMLQGMLKKDIKFREYKGVYLLPVVVTYYLGRLFSRNWLIDRYHTVSKTKDTSDTIHISNELFRFIGLSYQQCFFAEKIFLNFEGIMFTAPKNWDQALRLYYGDDYMVPKRVDYFA